MSSVRKINVSSSLSDVAQLNALQCEQKIVKLVTDHGPVTVAMPLSRLRHRLLPARPSSNRASVYRAVDGGDHTRTSMR